MHPREPHKLFLLVATTACVSLFSQSVWADQIKSDPYEESDRVDPFVSLEDRRFGLATSNLYFRYARGRDPGGAGGLSDLFVGGLTARGLYGKRVGLGFGFDIELGVAAEAGFASAFHLYPAGVGLAIGPTGFVAAFLGIGVNGAKGTVPYAFAMPAELRFELDVTRRARAEGLFGVTFTPANDVRANGSTLLPGVAETTMGIGVRFGKTFPRDGINMGRGYWFRLERREIMRTIFLGLAFGIEIDAAQ